MSSDSAKMSHQDKEDAFKNILELYQKCKRNGDWAKFYIETCGGKEFFTISVCPAAGSGARTKTVVCNPKT